MKKISAIDLNKYFDKEIEFSGVVDSVRDLQWVQFIVLRDATGKVQVTIEKSEEKNKEMVELVSSLTTESVIKVSYEHSWRNRSTSSFSRVCFHFFRYIVHSLFLVPHQFHKNQQESYYTEI